MKRATFLLITLALPIAGCSKKTHPVEGLVVYQDGTPAKELAGWGITFEVKEPKVSPSGTIAADGKFTVGTYQDNDGAPTGTHRVAITPPQMLNDAPRPAQVIGKKYASFDTSGLTVEIVPRTNVVKLTVEKSK